MSIWFGNGLQLVTSCNMEKVRRQIFLYTVVWTKICLYMWGGGISLRTVTVVGWPHILGLTLTTWSLMSIVFNQHVDLYLKAMAATFHCGHRPQHLRVYRATTNGWREEYLRCQREAIHGRWSQQLVVIGSHNIEVVTVSRRHGHSVHVCCN